MSRPRVSAAFPLRRNTWPPATDDCLIRLIRSPHPHNVASAPRCQCATGCLPPACPARTRRALASASRPQLKSPFPGSSLCGSTIWHRLPHCSLASSRSLAVQPQIRKGNSHVAYLQTSYLFARTRRTPSLPSWQCLRPVESHSPHWHSARPLHLPHRGSRPLERHLVFV